MLKPPTKTSALDKPAAFRSALAKWFTTHGKDYPWRRTNDPYAILVSEVMLQQTQITTVLNRGFYSRFLEKFPDVHSLSQAGDDELLKTWEGLGYYRRARMLREAAKVVVADHGGKFPDDHADILDLPGVGRYTAGAVTSFAFDKPAPIVDGNISRVLSRLMDCDEPIDTTSKINQLWSWAEELLDAKKPRIHNSALMELGQTYCRPGVPDCMSCPVAKFCKTNEPESLPVKARKTVLTAVDEHVVFAMKDGQVLLQKQTEGRRVGMWRLPARTSTGKLLHKRKYGITRYNVTMHVHQPKGTIRPGEGEEWHSVENIESLVIPPADRAAIRTLIVDAEEIA